MNDHPGFQGLVILLVRIWIQGNQPIYTFHYLFVICNFLYTFAACIFNPDISYFI